MKNIFMIACLLLVGLVSCKKDNFDPVKQASVDDAAIQKFISDNNIPAVKHESGVYYQVLESGSGNISYNAQTWIEARYKGRLLNGSVFDETKVSPIRFQLGGVIVGWQIGIQKIQKGGKIRLLIPSQYGYGPQANGPIPANSVLDFDIELTEVSN